MKPITKRQILDNRFAFKDDEKLLVNALEVCNLIIENERMQRQLIKMSNDLDISRALIALRDLDQDYRYLDLRA